MYVKKLKRKCDVRGCRCTDVYAISNTREMGNSVIICRSCLEEALKAIDSVQLAEENSKTPTNTTPPTPSVSSSAHNSENEPTETTEETPTKKRTAKKAGDK